MERYSEYKDSGVKWLGEIPSHWEVMSIKYTGIFENGLTYSPADTAKEGTLVLRSSNIQDFHLSFKDNVFVKKVSSKLLVRKGDIIICSRNGSASLVGKCALVESDIEASFGAFMMRYRPVINPKYAYYLFQGSIGYYKGLFSTTTINQLTKSVLNDIKVAIPNLEEQVVIGSYLDAATSKIDKAIAMQQKMIDLLNERKQIIIQNAVTKGLDENVEMKDSGVEWIGMIPKHWEISKLKYLIDAPLKYGANEASDLIDYSCPRYIRITDIDTNGKLKEETYRSLPMNKAEPYLLKKGDLLFARSGATVGKAFLFEEDYAACYAGYLIKAHMDLQKVLPKFVYLYTQTFAYQRWKESIFIQATIQNISGERYANMQIPMPTLEEQNNIIDMLTPKMLRFDSAISNCQRQIALLQERKQIIINEVVTGKVKVS